jgi:hypothetical protein
MAELQIEIECKDGVDGDGTCQAVAQTVQNVLGLRPFVSAVPRHTLPRFELKAKRFYLLRE